MLLQKGLITNQQLTAALEQQAATREYVGTILIRMGSITEPQLMGALAEQMDVPYINLANRPIEAWVLEKIPASLARRYQLMPIDVQDNRLQLAMADPFNTQMLDELRVLLNCDLEPMLAGPSALQAALAHYYGEA
jgi:type IV pilus assembly protein PilB